MVETAVDLRSYIQATSLPDRAGADGGAQDTGSLVMGAKYT
jgi:hypothetical protein